MARSMNFTLRAVYLFFALGNLLFFTPIILLFALKDYPKLISILNDTYQIYALFILYFLMIFKLLSKKVDILFAFNELLGPIKLVKKYHEIFVKNSNFPIIWILFWVSFLICTIKAIVEVLA